MKTGKSLRGQLRAGGTPSVNGDYETRFKSAQSARFNATRKRAFTLMVTAG